jgi:phosphate acetyltransferase
MSDLLNEIVERAKADRQRIVLPEGDEERTLQAADRVLAEGIADLILLGNKEEIMAVARKFNLKNIGKATIIDPATSEKKEEYAQYFCELRKKKGMTIEEARKKMLDPDVFRLYDY